MGCLKNVRMEQRFQRLAHHIADLRVHLRTQDVFGDVEMLFLNLRQNLGSVLLLDWHIAHEMQNPFYLIPFVRVVHLQPGTLRLNVCMDELVVLHFVRATLAQDVCPRQPLLGGILVVVIHVFKLGKFFNLFCNV